MRGVYCILGPGGRAYVGCSKDVNARFRRHAHRLERGDHPNRWLQNAWSKHGAKAFQFTVLEEVKAVRQSLYAAEQRWLAHFSRLPNGVYNFADVPKTSCGFPSVERRI